VNILFLAVDVDLRRDRGDAVHVRELASNLESIGHSVRLMTSTPPSDATEAFRHVTRPASSSAQVLVGRELAAGWADVIYERRTSPKLSWAISRLALMPFALEVNGVLSDERERPTEVAPESLPGLRARIRRRMLLDAARIVSVSAGIRSDLISRYQLAPNHVVVIPNGADTTHFRPMDRLSCRSRLGLDTAPAVVCFVGNLVAWQGVEMLLDASTRLASVRPDLNVLIIGDGPELPGLKELAARMGLSDRVRFTGRVPYAMVPEYISASDVCVAPLSRGRKASPIKVFEYLACGRPVIVSDVDQIGEFVRRTGSGIVFEPEDINAFTAAIESIVEHPRESEAMGGRGRAAVVDAGSWKQTAHEVASVLQQASRQ